MSNTKARWLQTCILVGLAFACKAQVCCDPTCEDKGRQIALDLQGYLDKLPPPPTKDEHIVATLKRLKGQDAKGYKTLTGNYEDYITWLGAITKAHALCRAERKRFYSDVLENRDTIWMDALAKVWFKEKGTEPSAQFRSGLHGVTEVSWGGGAGGFASLSARHMLSLTPKGRFDGEWRRTGSHWRGLVGLDWLFDQRVSSLGGAVRAEYRFLDLGKEYGSWAACKALVDARCSADHAWLGGGLAAEAEYIGLLLIYSRMVERNAWSIRCGLQYRFAYRENKDPLP